MTDAQLAQCRMRLEHFLTDLVAPLGRSERRHWTAVYVRGLLLDGERKSIEPLAARVPDGNVQALQQLVGQSPWDWLPVWKRLAQHMTAKLEPDPAWVVDDTGFPKQGEHSVAVERQYSGTLGKIGNCQYEGRGWIGRHHHMALVMLAHAFLTLETLRRKKLLGGPCHRHAVSCRSCCSRGLVSAPIVAQRFRPFVGRRYLM
jgi:SRSO17 transposase